MPGWLTEVLKAFGLITPFVYAAATYGFFHWLDKKASGPAKKAISGWLQPREYDKAAVQRAILEIFDRVYTSPLLARRAFRRSAFITVAVLLIIISELMERHEIISKVEKRVVPSIIAVDWETLAIFISINVLADFGALFVIRRWLSKSALSPIKALLLGPFIGILLVAVVVFLRDVSSLILLYAAGINNEFSVHVGEWLLDLPGWQFHFAQTVDGAITISAFFVHLWLPFFALCVGLVKGLNYILLATKQVQWFIKQGQQHPLDALGLVATPLVFFGAIAVQWLVSK